MGSRMIVRHLLAMSLVFVSTTRAFKAAGFALSEGRVGNIILFDHGKDGLNTGWRPDRSSAENRYRGMTNGTSASCSANCVAYMASAVKISL
jgi:hypothetical protein